MLSFYLEAMDLFEMDDQIVFSALDNCWAPFDRARVFLCAHSFSRGYWHFAFTRPAIDVTGLISLEGEDGAALGASKDSLLSTSW